jgi:hypothetical protein
MRKNLARCALLALCLALLGACGTGSPGGGSGDPSQYQIEIAVNDGSSARSYTWAAKYQNVGFAQDSIYGHYYNIFCAADGTVGENYTYKHAYVYLPNSAAGHYTSADGVTGLVYHDALGNRYGVDPYDSQTSLAVDFSVDGKGFLRGSFSGTLSSPNAPPYGSVYVSVSGTFFSYFE